MARKKLLPWLAAIGGLVIGFLVKTEHQRQFEQAWYQVLPYLETVFAYLAYTFISKIGFEKWRNVFIWISVASCLYFVASLGTDLVDDEIIEVWEPTGTDYLVTFVRGAAAMFWGCLVARLAGVAPKLRDPEENSDDPQGTDSR